MKLKNRKLKFEDGEPRSIVSLSILPADFIIYAPPLQAAAAAPPPPIANSNTKSSNSSTVGGRSRSQSSSKPSPGFESSMALTIFVLLTALFFMGFFSVYLRCVASGRRSRRANFISNSRLQQLAAASSLSAASNINNSSKDEQGLDPITIGSLPILPYNCNYMSTTSNGGGICGGRLEFEDDDDGENKKCRVVVVDKDDCVVCLCEYEEGEMVKVIPYCGHLFHPECIDMWFISHSSCPLCRSTQLFPPSGPDEKQKQHQQQEEKEDDHDQGTVLVLRRAYSCSTNSSLLLGYNERLVMLKRSSSWS